jgi:predicted aspartyl protease
MPIKNISFSGPYPYLPIRIINPDTKKSYKTSGVIDTGASACIFPASVAKILGHKLEKGRLTKVPTANGSARIYWHTTSIEIFDLKGKVLHRILKKPMGYSPKLKAHLLGQEHFLEYFRLHIHYPQGLLSILNVG